MRLTTELGSYLLEALIATVLLTGAFVTTAQIYSLKLFKPLTIENDSTKTLRCEQKVRSDGITLTICNDLEHTYSTITGSL